MTLDAYLDYLSKSPIFQMSLSSKELFHSNLWGWLFHQTPETRKVFFPDAGEELKEAEISRETKHVDITIKVNDDQYFIENKLKSLPRLDQLENYSKIPGFKRGVVTGIVEPDFKLPGKWSFLSYEQIADGFKMVAKKMEDSYEKYLLEDYIETIRCIDGALRPAYQVSTYPVTIPPEVEKLRLADIYGKVVMTKLKKTLDENSEALDDGWRIGDIYFGNAPALTVVNNKKTAGNIGLMIQIQGHQYRFGISAEGTQNAEDVFKEGKKLGVFAKIGPKDKEITLGKHTGQTGLRDRYIKYTNKTENHVDVYQWRTIPQDTKFEQILDWIKEDTEFLSTKFA